MTQEERTFRDRLSSNFDQSKLTYNGKLSNGNDLITYYGKLFEVTPKGTMKPIRNTI